MAKNEILCRGLYGLFACFAVVCLTCSRLNGTVICSAKYQTESPNGRFKLTAVSPRTTLPYFAAAYEYTLYDHHENKALWNGWRHDYPPRRLYLSDEGWTVIWSWNEQLSFIDKFGRFKGRTPNLEESLPKQEQRWEYIGPVSTGGTQWANYSHSFFHRWKNRAYFIVRMWWDRHFVFDLQDGRQIEPDQHLSESIEEVEKTFVLNTLKEATLYKDQLNQNGFLTLKSMLPQDQPNEDDRTQVRKIPPSQKRLHWVRYYLPITALMAGRMKIKEAIPLLRQLEDISYCSFTHSRCAVLKHRVVIQLSLRRLGQKPRRLPGAVAFTCAVIDGREEAVDYDFVPSDLPREQNTGKLREGMKIVEVLSLMGQPDFIAPLMSRWEYDIDADEPYGLILAWEEGRAQSSVSTLASIEKRPAVWKNSNSRDHSIIHW